MAAFGPAIVLSRASDAFTIEAEPESLTVFNVMRFFGWVASSEKIIAALPGKPA